MSTIVTPTFRPASPAEIADGAFEVLRRAFGTLLAISVLVNVPLFVTAGALVWWVREQGLLWGTPRYFAGLALLSVAAGGAAWLRAIGTGAFTHASLVAIAEREPSAVGSLRAALRDAGAICAVLAIRAVAVALSVFACAFPAFIAAGAFAFVVHAIVLERRTVPGALLRSTRVSGHAAGGLLAAGTLATIGWMIGTVQILLTVRLGVALARTAFPLGEIPLLAPNVLPWIAAALAKIAIDPLVSAAAASAWVDGLIRSDGLDLELRSQRIAGETLLVDPEAPG